MRATRFRAAAGGPVGADAPGYSMIELVVVIAIMGVLAAYALPSWFDSRRNNLTMTKTRLVRDLRYAREIALQEHNPVVAKFDAVAESYTIYRYGTGVALADPSNTSKNLSFTLNGTGNSGGVNIVSAAFGATPGVRFNSWGAPCDTTGTALAAIGTVILNCGSYNDTLRVEPGTGYIR